MNEDVEKFWKEWVKDLNDDVAYYKKLARERGELNVKLAHQLERMVVAPTKSDEELNALNKEEKSKWICTACSKSTYETEYDYLASRDLHLECALKAELKEMKATEKKCPYCEAGL